MFGLLSTWDVAHDSRENNSTVVRKSTGGADDIHNLSLRKNEKMHFHKGDRGWGLFSFRVIVFVFFHSKWNFQFKCKICKITKFLNHDSKSMKVLFFFGFYVYMLCSVSSHEPNVLFIHVLFYGFLQFVAKHVLQK